MKNKLTKEQIGLDRITPSMLGTFEDCPKLFYYQCWLGLKLEDDRLHLDFGDAIHSAIAVVYLEYDNHFGGAWEAGQFENVKKRFLEKWTPSKVTETSFENFKETRFGKEMGFKNAKELYTYMKNDGLTMLKSYWNEKERLLAEYNHDWTDFEIPLKVEMRNPADPNDKLPIPLSMRIDAKHRTNVKMADFKTSKSKYDLEDTRKKIQGQCYLFGNLMDTGEFIRKFDYTVLRKDLKSPDRVEVVQLEYDEADMQAFYFRVEAILQKIAMREFDRPARGHANYCDCWKFEKELSVKDILLPVKINQ